MSTESANLPTPFNASLNDYYKECLKRNRFEVKNVRRNHGWGEWKQRISYKILSDTQNRKNEWTPSHFHNISCCGITECQFQDLQELHMEYKLKEHFDELVAKWIDVNVHTQDQRIVIAGLPLETPHQESQYDMEFYNRLNRCLQRLGFKPVVSSPYKNQNSSNVITVLVGQMPE